MRAARVPREAAPAQHCARFHPLADPHPNAFRLEVVIPGIASQVTVPQNHVVRPSPEFHGQPAAAEGIACGGDDTTVRGEHGRAHGHRKVVRVVQTLRVRRRASAALAALAGTPTSAAPRRDRRAAAATPPPRRARRG